MGCEDEETVHSGSGLNNMEVSLYVLREKGNGFTFCPIQPPTEPKHGGVNEPKGAIWCVDGSIAIVGLRADHQSYPGGETVILTTPEGILVGLVIWDSHGWRVSPRGQDMPKTSGTWPPPPPQAPPKPSLLARLYKRLAA